MTLTFPLVLKFTLTSLQFSSNAQTPPFSINTVPLTLFLDEGISQEKKSLLLNLPLMVNPLISSTKSKYK